MSIRLSRTLLAAALLLGPTTLVLAAGPSAEQALGLVPVQKDVDYNQPEQDEVARCTISVEKTNKTTGWVIKSPTGSVLRRFIDTNGDNVVDQWSYYLDGVEVYRDIDANYNGKADQCRWLGPAGIRWGIDEDEDGKLDHWKRISAEEVTAEVVLALAERDAARFRRVMLSKSELQSLGLDKERHEQLQKQLATLESEFISLANKQKLLGKNTAWQRFDALRPGIFPADPDAKTGDIKVYENVMAMADSDGKQRLVQIGTLVAVSGGWRLIDLPKPLSDDDNLGDAGFFFRTSAASRGLGAGGEDVANSAIQKLLSELEKIDGEGSDPTDPVVHRKRVALLEKIVDASTSGEEKEQWTRQLADTISLGAQAAPDADSIRRLQTLAHKLKADPSSGDLAAYVEFRYLMASYSQSLSQPKADFAKIQTEWLKKLESYVKAYPDSADTAEALLQLGMAEELAGQDDDAIKWYRQAVRSFPQTDPGKKAAGAARRLESVGKTIRLVGQGTNGQSVDLSRLKGKIVLIDYWATWCEPCKEDLKTVKELVAKYGRSGFTVIGISLDNDEAALQAYLKDNRLPWYHIYEAGGLESRLANEMGILTLPTKMLIDSNGKVINRNIHVSQVEDELRKMLGLDKGDEKKAPAARAPASRSGGTFRPPAGIRSPGGLTPSRRPR